MILSEPCTETLLMSADEEENESRGDIAFEWLLFGNSALPSEPMLRRAWDIASGMGLEHDRVPFVIRDFCPLYSKVQISLSQSRWINNGRFPCSLWFPVPLRIQRRKKTILAPNFADLVEAVFFRLTPLVTIATGGECPQDLKSVWPHFAADAIAIANQTPQLPWNGERIVHQRYSARQQSEVTQDGVIGHLILPNGPGALWPLMAAASVLHIGKGATFGFGRLVPTPIDLD